MGLLRKIRLPVILLCILGAGLWGYRYWQAHQGEFPDLPMDDVAGDRVAGMVDVVNGQAFIAGAQGAEFTPLKIRTPVMLGNVFRVPIGGFVQLKTNGNYLVGMDGEGEFVLEKAKVSPDRTIHTIQWFVRKGTLRAKPHDYDPGQHLIEVRTAIVRVFGTKSELGLRVNEAGGGQVWLVSGTALLIWNDGRRKELKSRGMDYL